MEEGETEGANSRKYMSGVLMHERKMVDFTSSKEVLDEPTRFSNSPIRRSMSTIVCISDLLGRVSSGSTTPEIPCVFLISFEVTAKSRTAPTSFALPSFPFLILSSLLRTSTSPLISSPGSTFSSSRSFCINGFEGSANSVSRAASSIWRSLRRCDNGIVRVIPEGSFGDDPRVGDGGYSYCVRVRAMRLIRKIT